MLLVLHEREFPKIQSDELIWAQNLFGQSLKKDNLSAFPLAQLMLLKATPRDPNVKATLFCKLLK